MPFNGCIWVLEPPPSHLRGTRKPCTPTPCLSTCGLDRAGQRSPSDRASAREQATHGESLTALAPLRSLELIIQEQAATKRGSSFLTCGPAHTSLSTAPGGKPGHI
ncbi:hypothetical protein NDU88_005250 [Pleurodeles waltl]|uniref:Uncharacterized protein n=1 Tax=Pleurodeles waltl TaxID=8319 RepID=A0AAV7NW28_PLEWA|nr:hypothetical protein NDU88_005250 [Pleurodeles waltl]